MESNKITIENFLDEQYSQSAIYASYRSIANYIDGMKPSSRKVVYTIKKRNIKSDVKVSRFASDVASETEYLHGEGSLASVISGMAQDFTGSNNDNLLYPSGSFGTRFVPIASAPRYIFTKKSKSFDNYFSSFDDSILIQQEFEGRIIEPKFFVPVLPLLLINGSEGIGTGFAQKILPRNRKEILEYIYSYLNGQTSSTPLKPFYSGFKGTIYKEEESAAWVIQGVIEVKNKTTVLITELPIGYSLSSYTKVLDSLVEKKIIKSFEDWSENDSFFYKVSVLKDFTLLSKDKILDKLKLRKRVVENLTCIDENNSIREFNSIEEIIESYIKIRLEYYLKRKQYLLDQYIKEILELTSKALFITKIISNEIHINNVSKEEIINQIGLYKDIIQIDNSFDYLLNMPLYSLTKEKYISLQKIIKNKKFEKFSLQKKTEKDLWEEDLN